MHLTSGELIELLTSDTYWPKFKPYFRGDKTIIKNKLLEIGSIRNSLAHFRPIKPEDIEVVKQNSRHTLLGVEQCLTNLFVQAVRVPTNTTDDWYRSVSTLGTEYIGTTFYFSSDERWITLNMIFLVPMLEMKKWSDSHFNYTLAKLNSANILEHFPSLTRCLTYMCESVSHPDFSDHMDIEIRKEIQLVFRRDVLEKEHATIKEELEKVLLKVSEECELLKKDNLARGDLIETTSGFSFWTKVEDKKEGRWYHEYSSLEQAYESAHPDEYWGRKAGSSDVIGGRTRYPWMPADVSQREGIFD